MSDSIVLPEPDSARPDGLAWWSGSLKHSVTRLANGEVRLSCQPDGPAVDDPRALGLALIAAADYSTPARPLAVGDTVSRDDVSRLQVGTWVQYAHRGQRGLVTGGEVFDGKPRALLSEHGEQLPFGDLVDEVWPLTVLGLPTGGVS